MSYTYDFHSLIYESPAVPAADAEEVRGGRRISYQDLLDEIRGIITREHSALIREVIHSALARKEIRMLIKKHVHRLHVYVTDEGMDKLNPLVDQLFDDLFGFGILTQYLDDEGVQEINANRWDDVEIVTADGFKKLTEKFTGPKQAQDITKRMAQLGGITVDGSTPDGDSQITEGIRIHVKVPPIIDEKASVHFSIRKQPRKNFTRDDFIENGTAIPEELDLSTLALSHGVSVGIVGGTYSGKTADMNYFLNSVPQQLRIYTIEESRELLLEKRNEAGQVTSRVMHTKTRFSTNPAANIDARKLLRDALWCHPDIIALSEMRGAEALDTMEAGRTGHTIISGLHAASAESGYKRIASMAMMAGAGYSENTLLQFAYESFPIMIFKKQLAPGIIRYIEVVEARHLPNDQYQVVPLFRYIPGKNAYEGKHEQVNAISEELAYQLRLGGATEEQLRPFIK